MGSAHHSGDPHTLERAEREDSDEVTAILEWHNGKDAVSCPICAIAQEYRVQREALNDLCAQLKTLVAHKWFDYVMLETGGVPDCAKDVEELLEQMGLE